MSNNIDIFHDWITETGYPNLAKAAEQVSLRYMNILDVGEDGKPSEIACEAHSAFRELDQALVVLSAMKEKLESLDY